MGKRRIDWSTIDEAARQRERVLTHSELRELGLSASSITRRIGPLGPWQRLLPGVVLMHRGTPTRRELVLAAARYAGASAVITGLDALAAQGLRRRPARLAPVHVLVPTNIQRRSQGYVQLERTRRLPPLNPRAGTGLTYAPVARAAIDACRHSERLDDVRAIIAEVVQQRLCSVDSVIRVVRHAPRQRTALSRSVLAEVSAGIRSVAEAKVRDLFHRHGVPAPLWNVQLLYGDGEPFLRPDAYWPDVAAALEIDSISWHVSPDDYQRTKARERLLTRSGVVVLSFTPREILDHPSRCVAEVRDLLRVAAQRPVPPHIRYRLQGAA